MRQLAITSSHENPLVQLRRRLILLLAGFSSITAATGLVVQIGAGVQRGQINVIGLAAVGVFLAGALVVLLLARQNRLSLAALVIVAALVFGALITTEISFALLATLAAISAATLGNFPIYLAANAVILGKLGFDIAAILQTSGEQTVAESSNRIVLVFTVIIISVVTRYFINTAERAIERAERNARLLGATATVGQIAATLLTLDELLPRAVELIRDHFAFYHVQVFLVDERGEQAILTASTGEVGQQLLERQHRLAVGSKSVIGRVTRSGEPAIARDTDSDAVYYRNELLPLTRSELALPLVDGDKIIGALDVQSTRPNAFSPADIQALQALANQLSIAIRNARLFEQQVLSVQENKRLFLEAEANLREIQRLNQQLTQRGWTDFLRRQRTGVTLDAEKLLPEANWSETLVAASQKREPVSATNGDGPVIAVPVLLRGEVIGAIEVEPGGEVNEAEAVEMVQAVAQRLAVSLDNARLFEEAQAAAAQEQRINAIVSQYQSVSSVDDLLRITLTELSQTLGAERGAIRLGSPPKEPVNGGLAS